MLASDYLSAICKRLLGDPACVGHSRLVKALCLMPMLLIGAMQSAPSLEAAEIIKTKYQYSAKVVCSLLLPHQDGGLARGTYRTVVNIHNPTDEEIVIVEKVALADQLGAAPGPFSVTPFRKTRLQPDGAVQVTCGNIAGFFCPINGVCVDFAFLDGFLVIQSPREIDVVGVYTARHTDGDVESIDVERVPARKNLAVVKVKADDKGQDVKERIQYPPQSYPPKSPPGAGPIPDSGISLGETVCFGTCPEYNMTIYPNEFYGLDSGRFTVNPGQSTGTLSAGSFAAANAALQTANFNSLPTNITPGNPACGTQVATDLPTATVSETTIAGMRTVTYYPGCFQASEKAALDQLVAELRTALQVETLVTP